MAFKQRQQQRFPHLSQWVRSSSAAGLGGFGLQAAGVDPVSTAHLDARRCGRVAMGDEARELSGIARQGVEAEQCQGFGEIRGGIHAGRGGENGSSSWLHQRDLGVDVAIVCECRRHPSDLREALPPLG